MLIYLITRSKVNKKVPVVYTIILLKLGGALGWRGWGHSTLCKTKFLWVLKFGQVGVWGTLIPNSPYVRRFFVFSSKTKFFAGLGVFLYIFYYFLLIFGIFFIIPLLNRISLLN